VEFWVGMRSGHTCITYIAKSKTGSKEMQVIHFDQDVQVCAKFSYPIFLCVLQCGHECSLLENCLGSRGYSLFSLAGIKVPIVFSLFFNTLEHSCVPFFLLF
jgi:hypothetical protein